MDTPLTDADLDAIETRYLAASAGPWTSHWEGRDHWGGASFVLMHRNGHQCDLYLHFDCAENSETQRLADQDFIANARQDVPALIAEVRRLRRDRALHADNV